MSRKNPFKGAIILTSIAALLAGLYFLLDPYFEERVEEQDSATLLFGGIDRQEIYELKLNHMRNEMRNETDAASASESLWLKRSADSNEVWSVSSVASDKTEKSYEADTASVTGILSTVIAARKEKSLSNIDAKDVGLTPPLYSMEISYGSPPQKKALLIGKDTPVDYLVYAKWADSPEIFLTSRSLRFGIDKESSDLRKKKVINRKLASLKELEIIAHDKKLFTKAENFSAAKDSKGDWSMKAGEKQIPLLSSELASYISSISNLAVREFVSEQGSAVYDSFGLEKPSFELKFTADEDLKDQHWILSSQENDGTTRYYFAEKSSPSIYEVNASFKDTLDVEPINFRESKVTNINSEEITAISIDIPQTASYHLEKVNGEWIFSHNKESDEEAFPVKKKLIEDMLRDLSKLEAEAFYDTESPRKLGLNAPTRIVELTHGGPSAGENTGTVLIFGNTQAELQVVNTQGLKSPAGVSIDINQLLPRERSAYINEAAIKKAEEAANSSKGKKVKLETTVSSPKDVKKLPAPITKVGHKYSAIMKLSNDVTLEMEFDAAKAPYTVSNFLHLARNKFYDDVVFHRVIPDFVIQGGDPTGNGTGGPGYKFDNEDNDLKHLRGSLSMAHAGRDTNGSQFFIVLQPQPHLDGVHTVFGKITKGDEHLDNIPQGTKMVTVEVFEEAL